MISLEIMGVGTPRTLLDLILIDQGVTLGLGSRKLIRNQGKLLVPGGVTLLLLNNVYIGGW